MKISRLALMVPLTLLLACGGDDTAGDTALEDPALGAPGGEPPPPTTPAPTATPGAAGASQTVQMQPLRDSGISGEATLTRTNGQTQVMVTLTGTPGNTTHPGHIHTGTCDNPGPPVQPLESVSTDATGRGTATSNVEIDPATLFNGQHVVQYHQAGGGPGVVCGQIQQQGA